MQRLDVAVYPHLRDQSLVVSRGRLIELPLSADRVTELLAGDGQPGPERSETEGAADVVAAKRLVLELLRLTPRFAAAPPATSLATLIVADAAMMDAVGDIISSALEPAMRVVEVVETSQWATLAVPEPIDVLVTLSGTFDYCPMAGWEDWATEHGCRWAPFYLTDAGAGFGPFVQSGHTPGVRDLAGRWVSAAKKESQARSMLSPPAMILGRPVARSFLVWAVATFLADLCSWLEGRAALGSWHNVRLHADRLDIQRDPVLPLPGLWLGSAAGSPDVTGSPLSPDDVLNPKTGIVVGTRSITFTSAIPDGISYVESQTADLGRLQPWASNIYNAGSSWESPAEAQQGALGEAIERYCGNLVDHSALVQASYAGLNRKGERAVDPRTLVLFSDKQYAAAGFPFVPFDLDLRVSWTVAQSLATDERVWVPASLVFVNWNTGQSMYDPPTNPAYYPGIAAGTSRDHAICNALEEVVERDAAMIWWLSGARIPTSCGPPNEFVAKRSQAGSALSIELAAIPNRIGFPVLAGVVTDAHSGICTLGLAARCTPEQAALKALLEGFGLLESALDMQDPEGGFWQAYDEVDVAQAVKPIDPARRYLDSYRADFRDVTDLFCQLQIQLDPRARAIVSSRWTATEQVPWDSLDRLPERSPARYVQQLTNAGFEPLLVDLTTADARAAGWHAVRVIVPGLVPNFPTAFAPLGGGRVSTEPTHLGLVDQPLTDESVWRFPMPYA